MAFNRKARLQANINAIRTAFALRDEVRIPTESERETISQYCGFGGLKFVLNPVDNRSATIGDACLSNKAVWPKSDLPLYDLTAELHSLIREHTNETCLKSHRNLPDFCETLGKFPNWGFRVPIFMLFA